MKNFFFFIIFFLAIFNNISGQCTQLDAGDDVMLDCTNNCTTLKAELFSSMGAQTDTYTITKATPCPLPVSSTTPTNLHIDDQWSSVIQLPFTFYFFGQAYDRLILSSNGVVSFDINRTSPLNQQPNSYSTWQFSDSLPSTNMFRNAIFGAYHDLNPEATQANVIKYFISGTYPQRKFVLSFENVPQFSCENLTTTQKIILYETSNVIDVQIDHKALCAGWNDGNAVIGIQNEQGTLAYVPPGRNTGQWTVRASDPELWRFVPNHNVPNINYDFKWYNNETNDLVGTGQSINVCVTENTTYRVEADFDDPNTGQHYTLTDIVTAFFNRVLGTPDLGPDQTVCFGNTVNILSNVVNVDSYEWLVNGVVSSNTTDQLSLVSPGDYDVTLNVYNGVCHDSDSIHIKILEPVSVVVTPVLYGELLIEATGGLPPYQYSVDGVNFQDSNHFTHLPNGDYHISIKDSNNCKYPDKASVHVINLITPHFFTPNNDSYNDYWRIENAENTPDADLYIYDRYGKLMKHMKSTVNDTWDGTFNNVPVFASDYWYILVLPNGKTYKGHFSLKR